MTLDPATLIKCQEAIPALTEVYDTLLAQLGQGEGNLPKIEQAADALWHWPELVAAAAELYELKKRGQYHSLQVGKP